MPLSDGRALKLTTSHYYTPSGASINDVGIQPDLPYAGADVPPAEMDEGDARPTLATRDEEIRFALTTLKGGPALARTVRMPPR
jgi:carboxyl-terminal processing protease